MIKEPLACRLGAERVRVIASHVRSAAQREQWNKLADAYERMARVAEAVARDED